MQWVNEGEYRKPTSVKNPEIVAKVTPKLAGWFHFNCVEERMEIFSKARPLHQDLASWWAKQIALAKLLHNNKVLKLDGVCNVSGDPAESLVC